MDEKKKDKLAEGIAFRKNSMFGSSVMLCSECIANLRNRGCTIYRGDRYIRTKQLKLEEAIGFPHLEFVCDNCKKAEEKTPTLTECVVYERR
jgi:hypothetical protein